MHQRQCEPNARVEEMLQQLRDDKRLVDPSQIQLNQRLGSGHFGTVLAADFHTNGETVAVAVKQLLPNASPDLLLSFLEEAVLMLDFDHPHVMQVIAVAISETTAPSLLLPLMTSGDLLSFLRTGKATDMKVRQLLSIGADVARGMAYLVSKRIVHRDVASRNCLLDEQLNVRIADFGLSRDVYANECYTARDASQSLAIRWMAPECLTDQRFTHASDVWSFGVLMWEITSLGATPFADCSSRHVLALLQSGTRLQQPSLCPDFLYDLMLACWHEDPEERVGFPAIVDRMDCELSVECLYENLCQHATPSRGSSKDKTVV